MTIASLPTVKLDGNNYPVDHWLTREGREDHIDLDAPYQRGSVWTVEQRRALIKSILMGLPVGNIIVAEQPFHPDKPPFRVLDGKQRIETLRAFVGDRFSVPGWWFPNEDVQDPDWRSMDVIYSQLSQQGQRHFTNRLLGSLTFKPEYDVTSNPNYDASLLDKYNKPVAGVAEDDQRLKRYIWRKRSDEEILKVEAELYGLINSGGTAQTPEDLARAAEIAR
jgi:hypothetical protein